ncbi:unnamed protein product [Lasius platythorax]|uniref:Uncharacterized protein n=1 Tax=Lasius platythorax TaxID=488582 RepID=A0AAV2N5V4_9HYME
MAMLFRKLFLGTAIFTLVKVGAGPTRYDQRQEGDFNLHAKLENLLFVVAIPSNNDLLGDLALQALELKQQLVSRSKEQESIDPIKSDEETRGVEPYSVEIIQINENHANEGSSVIKTEGNNKEIANISNQQAIFSFTNRQNQSEINERNAKNVKAFESDEETRGVEPYSVGIIQINENHANKGSSVIKTDGSNKEMATVSNQQAIFSFTNQQNQSEVNERNAKNVKAFESDEETHSVKPYSVGIIQINENHANKGSSVIKANGTNKDMAVISNQQTIFSIANQQNQSEVNERSAKNVKAFEFPKSREEPTIMAYFVDARKILGSKIEDDGRARNVVKNIWNPDVESGRLGTSLKKQLLRREEDVALPLSNADKNDVAPLSEDKQQNELKLLGDGIENCGPGRHRDASGICQFDESASAPF